MGLPFLDGGGHGKVKVTTWNDVCHGITPVAAFSPQLTDRIFHALLVLALLRAQVETAAEPR